MAFCTRCCRQKCGVAPCCADRTRRAVGRIRAGGARGAGGGTARGGRDGAGGAQGAGGGERGDVAVEPEDGGDLGGRDGAAVDPEIVDEACTRFIKFRYLLEGSFARMHDIAAIQALS
jgi:hypothetical protein